MVSLEYKPLCTHGEIAVVCCFVFARKSHVLAHGVQAKSLGQTLSLSLSLYIYIYVGVGHALTCSTAGTALSVRHRGGGTGDERAGDLFADYCRVLERGRR